MIRCGKRPVGVCSWSLRQDIGDVIETLDSLGIDHVHLSLWPVLGERDGDYIETAAGHHWTISCTMINFPQEDYSTLETIRATGGVGPDDCWDRNRDLFRQAVRLTAQLGVPYLSTHAGFIDHSDSSYVRKFYDRVRCLADLAGEENVMLLMETGQESGQELKCFLEELDHSAVGVNFDPANMILYDKGDPVEAVQTLGPWIKHIHVKDAVRTQKPGTWGTEVPWCKGDVDTERFLKTLEAIGFDGVLAIEREMGEDRKADITYAIERLQEFKG